MSKLDRLKTLSKAEQFWEETRCLTASKNFLEGFVDEDLEIVPELKPAQESKKKYQDKSIPLNRKKNRWNRVKRSFLRIKRFGAPEPEIEQSDYLDPETDVPTGIFVTSDSLRKL